MAFKKVVVGIAFALLQNFLAFGSEEKYRQLFIAARHGNVADIRVNHCLWWEKNDKKYVHIPKERFAQAYTILHTAKDLPDSELPTTLAASIDEKWEDCNEYLTALDVAAIEGHVAAVDVLSRHARTLGDGLLFAIHRQNGRVVRILVGRMVSERDHSHKKLLYQKFAMAVACGNPDIVRIFLDNKCGLNPNAFSNNRQPMRSVFHIAASRGHEAVLKQLIEYEYDDIHPVDETVRMQECIDVLEPIVGKHTPIVRTVLEYKGVEVVGRDEVGKELVMDYVLPSMEFVDCEDLTALEYAQRHHDADDEQGRRAKLAACIALLQHQQAGFSNFFVNKFFKP